MNEVFSFLVLWLTFPRYSEFDDLRNKLLITFPHSEAAMPPLPPKSIVCKPLTIRFDLFACTHAMRRQVSSEVPGKAENWSGIFPQVRTGLPINGRALLTSGSCILLNPEFSGSPVLKEFIFS